ASCSRGCHAQGWDRPTVVVRFRFAPPHNNEGWLTNSESGTITGGRSKERVYSKAYRTKDEARQSVFEFTVPNYNMRNVD
ncbi:MAG: hypothetical protein HOC20_07305, partial [Chloroflexi bacterium]|nr:hypothetical protein [Chloroflexota bacterium]